MIKSTRQYRAVPSFDEVMKSEQAKPIPSFDEVMGNDKKKVPTVGGDVSNNSSQNTNLSLGGEKNQNTYDPVRDALNPLRIQHQQAQSLFDPLRNRSVSDQTRANVLPVGVRNQQFEESDFNIKKTNEKAASVNLTQAEQGIKKQLRNVNIAKSVLQKVKQENGGVIPQDNETAKIAQQAIVDHEPTVKDLTEKASKSKDLNEFLRLYTGGGFPILKEGTKASEMAKMIDDPDVEVALKNSPKLYKEFLQTKSDFNNKFPNVAKQRIASQIAQWREDAGQNSVIYNDPSKQNLDKLVEDKYNKGEINAIDRAFYYQNIKPNDIPTTGVINEFGRNYEQATRNSQFGRLLANIGLLENPQDKYEFQAHVTPTKHPILAGSAELIGQLTPMILTSTALKGAGFSDKQAGMAAAVNQFAGQNEDESKNLFPKDRIKQLAYTGLATWFDAAAMELPMGKLRSSVQQFLKGEAKPLVNTLMNSAVSDAVKQDAQNALMNRLKNFVVQTTKNTASTAGVLTMFDIAHKGLRYIGGDPNAGKEIANTNIVEEYLGNAEKAPILGAFQSLGALVSQPKSELHTAINELPDNMYTSEIKKSLNEGNVPKLETYLKDISEQLNNPQSSEVTRKVFGEKLSDIATKLYPNAKSEPINIEQSINQGSGEDMSKGEQGVGGELGKGVEVGTNSSGEGVGDKTVVKTKDLPEDLQTFLFEESERNGVPTKDEYDIQKIDVSSLPTVRESDLDVSRGSKYAEENFSQDQKHPIVIVDGKVEDGFHRLYQAQKEGREKIDAIVIDTKQPTNEVSIPTEKESTPIKEPNQNIQNTKDRLSEIYKKSPSKIDKILKDFEGDYSISSLAKEVVEQNKKPFKAATDEEIKRVKQAKSVGEVLGIIQETTIDPHLKEVAKVIAENLHKAPFLKLEFDLPKDRYGYPVDANGSYGGGIATINPSSFWKRTNNYHSRGLDTGYKTILHELTHAFTIDAYRSPKTPIEKEFRNYIDKTYKELKSNSMFDKQYGFKSQEEFIAEVLTNPEFRLSAPIYKSGILDKIIEYVAKIFGYNKDKDAISDARYEKIKEAFDFILKKIPDIRAGEGKKIFYEEGDLLGRLADAYHKAKESGKNPELVKAVEELLNEKSDEISKPTESESLATKKVDTNIQPTSEGEKAIEQSPIGKPIEVQQQEQEQRQPPNGIEPPSETPPVEKKGVYVERPATELSHRGLQDVANEFSLDDVKSRDTKTDIQLRQDAENTINDWKEKGEYATKVEGLVKKAETKGVLTDEERVIFEQHIANVIGEARKLDKNSPEYDAKLQEIKRLKDAGEITRSAAGAALRIPSNSGSYPRTVEDAMVERMEAAGVDTLTPEQKKDVEEKFSMYESKQKEAEERIADLEKKNMELQAEIELAKQRKATKTVKKDFKAERQNIRNSIKEKWAKAASDNTLTAVPLPYAKQLAAISPDVAKLMKSYIEEGITTFSEIVDKIHDDIKDVVKNREDVIDILAGKYNESKESKIDLLTKLKQIKDKKSAEAIKIIAKLRTGDFEKVKKPKSIFDNPDLIKKYPKEYKQTMDAIVASDKAKHELALANLNEEMKNRTWGQKTVGEFGRVFRTLKALKAGIDDSGVGVQTLLAGLANPASFAAAFKEHLLDAMSAARFERNLARLHNSDFWPLIEKSGLSVVDPKSLRESEKNDIFNDTYFDYMKVKVKGKEYSFAFTKPFERAFTSLGNNLRVNMFLRRAEQLMNSKKNPMTYETHPEEFEALAKVINNLSGRGTMNSKLEAHNQLLSTVLWSPKLLASSINVLGLGEFSGNGFYRSLTKAQKKYVAAQLVKGIGTGVILMAILSTSQDGESDLDPLSPTFGTVKVGDYRYTIFGRYNSVVRTAAMLYGEKHTTKGVDDLFDNKGSDIEKEGIKFFRGKINPTVGIAWNLITRKDFNKKPITIEGELQNAAIPMSVDDIRKGLSQDGTLGILKRGIPSFFGVKVSNEADFQKATATGGGAGAKGNFKKSKKPTKPHKN